MKSQCKGLWCLILIAVMLLGVASARAGTLELVSVGLDGNPAPGMISSSATSRDFIGANYCSLSADGRYVVFSSDSTNLVADDTNGKRDIFVFDRISKTIERVSVSSSGEQANNGSTKTLISSDGRYVGFYSAATNLVPGDTNNMMDIFIHDRLTKSTERINVSSTGIQADSTNGLFERDFVGTQFSMSADGRFVAFAAAARTLSPYAPGPNGRMNIFIRDRQNNTTEYISGPGNGVQNGNCLYPAITADGSQVIFYFMGSNGTNYGAYVHDRQTGATELLFSYFPYGFGNSRLSITPDGRFIAFNSSQINGVPAPAPTASVQIFLFDRQSGTLEMISKSSTGELGNNMSIPHSISADGRFVAFVSNANNLVSGDTNNTPDVFVRDRVSNTTERISDGFGLCSNGLSNDGRFLAISRILPGYGNVSGNQSFYLYDRQPQPIEQAITFNPPATRTFGDPVIDLSAYATGGGSGNPVTFAVTSGPGVLSGTLLTITGAGDIVIKASQAGNADYSAATDVQRTIAVAKANTPVILSNLNHTYDGTVKRVTVSSNGIVQISYNDALGNSVATPVNAGSYKVTAFVSDPNYQGSATATMTIAKAGQSIVFSPTTAKTFGDISFDLSQYATGGASSNPVTFSVASGPGVLNGNLLTITGAGSIVITASQAGSANYTAAPDVQKTITVGKATALVTLGNLTQICDGSEKSATATTTPAGLTTILTYIDANGNPVVGPVNVGSYTVTALVDDKNYQGSAAGTLIIKYDVLPKLTITTTPNVLWPPNNKMVSVSISGGVTPTNNNIASIAINLVDEYGIHNYSNLQFGSAVMLEAARDGYDKDGRVYTVTALLTLKDGRRVTEVTTVTVPHDWSDYGKIR